MNQTEIYDFFSTMPTDLFKIVNSYYDLYKDTHKQKYIKSLNLIHTIDKKVNRRDFEGDDFLTYYDFYNSLNFFDSRLFDKLWNLDFSYYEMSDYFDEYKKSYYIRNNIGKYSCNTYYKYILFYENDYNFREYRQFLYINKELFKRKRMNCNFNDLMIGVPKNAYDSSSTKWYDRRDYIKDRKIKNIYDWVIDEISQKPKIN